MGIHPGQQTKSGSDSSPSDASGAYERPIAHGDSENHDSNPTSGEDEASGSSRQKSDHADELTGRVMEGLIRHSRRNRWRVIRLYCLSFLGLGTLAAVAAYFLWKYVPEMAFWLEPLRSQVELLLPK